MYMKKVYIYIVIFFTFILISCQTKYTEINSLIEKGDYKKAENLISKVITTEKMSEKEKNVMLFEIERMNRDRRGSPRASCGQATRSSSRDPWGSIRRVGGGGSSWVAGRERRWIQSRLSIDVRGKAITFPCRHLNAGNCLQDPGRFIRTPRSSKDHP